MCRGPINGTQRLLKVVNTSKLAHSCTGRERQQKPQLSLHMQYSKMLPSKIPADRSAGFCRRCHSQKCAGGEVCLQGPWSPFSLFSQSIWQGLMPSGFPQWQLLCCPSQDSILSSTLSFSFFCPLSSSPMLSFLRAVLSLKRMW